MKAEEKVHGKVRLQKLSRSACCVHSSRYDYSNNLLAINMEKVMHSAQKQLYVFSFKSHFLE